MEIITEQSDSQLAPQVDLPVNKKSPKISKRQMTLALIVVLASAVLLVATILLTAGARQSDMIQKNLHNIQSAMKQKYTQNGAYPATIDNLVPILGDNISVEGSVSFDGTKYCISAYSNNDKSQIYSITDNREDVSKGSCKDLDNQKLFKVGGLSVQLVTKNSIKAGWQAVVGADKYTLNCSSDKKFKEIDSETVAAEPNATCSNLKSKTEYYFRVKASNNKGDSDWSDLAKIRTY